MFFNDGVKRVDYVLVWSTKGKEAKLEQSKEARRIYEDNLTDEGLILEYDIKVQKTGALLLQF